MKPEVTIRPRKLSNEEFAGIQGSSLYTCMIQQKVHVRLPREYTQGLTLSEISKLERELQSVLEEIAQTCATAPYHITPGLYDEGTMVYFADPKDMDAASVMINHITLPDPDNNT